MLLDYHDGSQEVLGQWRWDFPIETISTDEKSQFVCYTMHESYVTALGFETEAKNISDEAWNYANIRGTLIWWFNQYSHACLEFH